MEDTISSVIAYCISPYFSFYAGLSCEEYCLQKCLPCHDILTCIITQQMALPVFHTCGIEQVCDYGAVSPRWKSKSELKEFEAKLEKIFNLIENYSCKVISKVNPAKCNVAQFSDLSKCNWPWPSDWTKVKCKYANWKQMQDFLFEWH